MKIFLLLTETFPPNQHYTPEPKCLNYYQHKSDQFSIVSSRPSRRVSPMLITAARWIHANFQTWCWEDLVILCNLICIGFGIMYDGPRWVHRLLYCFLGLQSVIMLLIIESLLLMRERGVNAEMAEREEVRVIEAEKRAHELEMKRIEAELVKNRWELML